MKTKYKHIHFVVAGETSGKAWECQKQKSNAVLGGIFFYEKWRQYCFVPEHGTFFDGTCLADIIHFMSQLRIGKNRKKTNNGNMRKL